MNKHKMYLLIFMTLSLMLNACQTLNTNDYRWVITNLNGAEIVTINDKSQLEELNKSWKGKREVLVKKKPKFDFELHIYQKNQLTKWLYSKNGYVMSKDNKQDIIYQVKLELFNGSLSL